MAEELIGRAEEIEQFQNYYNSGKAEFVALYGRRRVGKTFLVRQLYGSDFAFHVTGVMEGSKQMQMTAFSQAMKQYGYKGRKPKTWLEAFFELQMLLSERIIPGKRCLIFIDELPCFDTPKAGFVNAISNFWNNWANWVPEVMLIVCGSATSWMISNIIDNHGGLHNRITHEIHLKPFTLGETELYFKAHHSAWPRATILQAYMAVGGVPYYLSLFSPNESLATGLDRLFFKDGGELAKEYDRLYKSLFRNPDIYLKIIGALAKKKSGLTRIEICDAIKADNNGHLSEALLNLQYCDIIRYAKIRSEKIKDNEGIFQLIDFYTIFYHHFISHSGTDEQYWSTHIGRPELNSWFGLSFERVCIAHIPQIRRKLRIDGISTQCYAWRSTGIATSEDVSRGAQIDLIIERADQMINLCEIKYCNSTYILKADEDEKIHNRAEVFRQETRTRCGIFLTMITTYGLAKGLYSSNIHVEVTMDDLFE